MLARIPDSSSRIPDSSSDQRTGYDPSFVGPPIEPPAPRGRRRSRGRITRRERHDFPWHSVEADNCAGGWQNIDGSSLPDPNDPNAIGRDGLEFILDPRLDADVQTDNPVYKRNRLEEGWPVNVFQLAPLTQETDDEIVQALDPAVNADQRAWCGGDVTGVAFNIEQIVGALHGSDDVAGARRHCMSRCPARLCASQNVVSVVEGRRHRREIDRSLLLAVLTLSQADLDHIIDQL